MKYVPNLITLSRLIMVPLFAVIYFSDLKYAPVFALLLFILAGLTDALDGYLARKYQVISVVGIVLDPLADKLMLLTVLGCFTVKGIIPVGAMAAMLVVEGLLILAGVYLYFYKEKEVIPAGKTGKAATVIFTLAVCMLMIIPNFMLSHIIFWTALATKIISFLYYAKEHIRKIF